MKKNEILRSYGTDYKEMTKRLLEQADLLSDIPDDAETIGIKPNLVTPTPASFGATTHPEILAGIIEYLQESGRPFHILIAEGSWVGDRTSEAFEYCGYNGLKEKYGVTLVDTQKDGSREVIPEQMGTTIPSEKRIIAKAKAEKPLSLRVNNCVQEFDYLINVPVLKGHCQTKITCALKNMKGLIPNSEKRRFHTLGLHKPIAALNTCIKQDFIVVDHICGDLDFEEGGNPVQRDCIMVAKDPVLLDAFVCRLLGYKTEDVPYVKMAEAFGVGSADLSQLKLITCECADNLRVEDPDSTAADAKTVYGQKLLAVSYAVDEIDSCSACYGMLIPALSRLKEEGFLDKLPCQISIGQGHRGKTGTLGIGNCTNKFDYYIKGCPPSEEEIYEGLKKYLAK